MFHILTGKKHRAVLCGATGDIDRTRAHWITDPIGNPVMCQGCAVKVTPELVDSEQKASFDHVAKAPRKPNFAAIRRILRKTQ